jgi:glutathione S-transferase
VRLVLCQLGIAFERVELDILEGATRSAEFRAKNPNGRVPLLEIAPGDYLAESNAILCYLAEGTPYMPASPRSRATALQWLFFEQYSHEPNIATARHWLAHRLLDAEKRAALPAKMALGYAALEVMERHLSSRRFFVDERYTIADIALYAYTHVAAEGGFALERYGAIARWLADVATQPGHIAITEQVGAGAGADLAEPPAAYAASFRAMGA